MKHLWRRFCFMFRIRSISLFSKGREIEYSFSDNAYVYGHNSKGKTALVKVIDYVLGHNVPKRNESDTIHDGLDNIDEFGLYIVNDGRELWLKRKLKGDYLYKRTKTSDYTIISEKKYKELICELITDKVDDNKINVYEKVFEETPTFRSFVFLNFIDEIGQGDLESVFTQGREVKNVFRIRKIMDFFFNYENIEKIYEKRTELEKLENEQKELYDKKRLYSSCVSQIKQFFSQLGLDYSDDMSANYDSFNAFQHNFTREHSKPIGDFIYYSKVSHDLSEEIKLYSFLREQSKETEDRKKRTSYLLALLQSLVEDNNQYAEDVETIKEKVNAIQKDMKLLSFLDYEASISQVEDEKKKIDEKIEALKSKSSRSDYEETIKAIAILENEFNIIKSIVDFSDYSTNEKEISLLKTEIKRLQNSYDAKTLEDFNNKLTKLYLESDLHKVDFLKTDRQEEDFCLVFNPFGQTLIAKHKENGHTSTYSPGGQGRNVYFQLLVYICMLWFLKERFSDFIYLPLLVVDSADQSIQNNYFDEIYPYAIDIAKRIGVQTIFLSKYKPNSIKNEDFVDITKGLNPFHKGE